MTPDFFWISLNYLHRSKNILPPWAMYSTVFLLPSRSFCGSHFVSITFWGTSGQFPSYLITTFWGNFLWTHHDNLESLMRNYHLSGNNESLVTKSYLKAAMSFSMMSSGARFTREPKLTTMSPSSAVATKSANSLGRGRGSCAPAPPDHRKTFLNLYFHPGSRSKTDRRGFQELLS